MKKMSKTPLATAMGTILVSSLTATSAQAETNPFSLTELSNGYMQVAEGDKGYTVKTFPKTESDMKKGFSVKPFSGKDKEASCGEGKCGAMMENGKMKKGMENVCGAMMKGKEGACGMGETKAMEGKCGEGKCGAMMENGKMKKGMENVCGAMMKGKEGACGMGMKDMKDMKDMKGMMKDGEMSCGAMMKEGAKKKGEMSCGAKMKGGEMSCGSKVDAKKAAGE